MKTNGEVLTTGLISIGYSQKNANKISYLYLQYGKSFISPIHDKNCKMIMKKSKKSNKGKGK